MSLEELKAESPKVKRTAGIILSERDLDIIEFILEMKFSNVQHVFERFFKTTLSGAPAKSQEWAVRRLQQLERFGLLKGTYAFSERAKFYLGTLKGYRIVLNKRFYKEAVKPSQSIDHATFVHDKLIIQARIMLENSGRATNWVSDRHLRSHINLFSDLKAYAIPDGIYINPEGQKVAFEMERSKKTKEDYRKKISRYVAIMRVQDAKLRLFDRVLYVCEKESAIKFFSTETRIYGELFEVQRASEFFGKSEQQVHSKEQSLDREGIHSSSEGVMPRCGVGDF